ncbi:hypothetical protein FBZ90_109162 [Nitrospirillum pindoramense]|uniref:Uncharacterized protein n=1 Tax=Nitrospirillum amazonense TaxID=28077 RepID=A0A560H3Z7_9PROT|nr:hypothetical protein FBZ90_109162 [Nitrospirillum amazonense]
MPRRRVVSGGTLPHVALDSKPLACVMLTPCELFLPYE